MATKLAAADAALLMACKSKKQNKISDALKHGGRFSTARTPEGNTALHIAALEGDHAMAKVLLHLQHEPTVVNDAGQLPSQSAAEAGHAELAHFLHERLEAFVGRLRPKLAAVLLAHAKHGRWREISELLPYLTDPNGVLDESGRSLYFLVLSSPDSPASLRSTLVSMGGRLHVGDIVALAEEALLPPHAQAQSIPAASESSAGQQHSESHYDKVARLVISAQDGVMPIDQWITTPSDQLDIHLAAAACMRNVPMFVATAEAGANVNLVRPSGLTPLHLLVRTLTAFGPFSHPEVSALAPVLKCMHGATLDRNDPHTKMTALHYAVTVYDAHLVLALLNAGAKVDPLDGSKRTPMELALALLDKPVTGSPTDTPYLRQAYLTCWHLLAAHANPTRDGDDESAFFLALRTGSIPFVSLFARRQVRTKMHPNVGPSALALSVPARRFCSCCAERGETDGRRSGLQQCKHLLNHLLEVWVPPGYMLQDALCTAPGSSGAQGHTPLMQAAKHGAAFHVMRLLEAGVNSGVSTAGGDTALLLAQSTLHKLQNLVSKQKELYEKRRSLQESVAKLTTLQKGLQGVHESLSSVASDAGEFASQQALASDSTSLSTTAGSSHAALMSSISKAEYAAAQELSATLSKVDWTFSTECWGRTGVGGGGSSGGLMGVAGAGSKGAFFPPQLEQIVGRSVGSSGDAGSSSKGSSMLHVTQGHLDQYQLIIDMLSGRTPVQPRRQPLPVQCLTLLVANKDDRITPGSIARYAELWNPWGMTYPLAYALLCLPQPRHMTMGEQKAHVAHLKARVKLQTNAHDALKAILEARAAAESARRAEGTEASEDGTDSSSGESTSAREKLLEQMRENEQFDEVYRAMQTALGIPPYATYLANQMANKITANRGEGVTMEDVLRVAALPPEQQEAVLYKHFDVAPLVEWSRRRSTLVPPWSYLHSESALKRHGGSSGPGPVPVPVPMPVPAQRAGPGLHTGTVMLATTEVAPTAARNTVVDVCDTVDTLIMAAPAVADPGAALVQRLKDLTSKAGLNVDGTVATAGGSLPNAGTPAATGAAAAGASTEQKDKLVSVKQLVAGKGKEKASSAAAAGAKAASTGTGSSPAPAAVPSTAAGGATSRLPFDTPSPNTDPVLPPVRVLADFATGEFDPLLFACCALLLIFAPAHSSTVWQDIATNLQEKGTLDAEGLVASYVFRKEAAAWFALEVVGGIPADVKQCCDLNARLIATALTQRKVNQTFLSACIRRFNDTLAKHGERLAHLAIRSLDGLPYIPSMASSSSSSSLPAPADTQAQGQGADWLYKRVRLERQKLQLCFGYYVATRGWNKRLAAQVVKVVLEQWILDAEEEKGEMLAQPKPEAEAAADEAHTASGSYLPSTSPSVPPNLLLPRQFFAIETLFGLDNCRLSEEGVEVLCALAERIVSTEFEGELGQVMEWIPSSHTLLSCLQSGERSLRLGLAAACSSHGKATPSASGTSAQGSASTSATGASPVHPGPISPSELPVRTASQRRVCKLASWMQGVMEGKKVNEYPEACRSAFAAAVLAELQLVQQAALMHCIPPKAYEYLSHFSGAHDFPTGPSSSTSSAAAAAAAPAGTHGTPHMPGGEAAAERTGGVKNSRKDGSSDAARKDSASPFSATPSPSSSFELAPTVRDIVHFENGASPLHALVEDTCGLLTAHEDGTERFVLSREEINSEFCWIPAHAALARDLAALTMPSGIVIARPALSAMADKQYQAGQGQGQGQGAKEKGAAKGAEDSEEDGEVVFVRVTVASMSRAVTEAGGPMAFASGGPAGAAAPHHLVRLVVPSQSQQKDGTEHPIRAESPPPGFSQAPGLGSLFSLESRGGTVTAASMQAAAQASGGSQNYETCIQSVDGNDIGEDGVVVIAVGGASALKARCKTSTEEWMRHLARMYEGKPGTEGEGAGSASSAAVLTAQYNEYSLTYRPPPPSLSSAPTTSEATSLGLKVWEWLGPYFQGKMTGAPANSPFCSSGGGAGGHSLSSSPLGSVSLAGKDKEKEKEREEYPIEDRIMMAADEAEAQHLTELDISVQDMVDEAWARRKLHGAVVLHGRSWQDPSQSVPPLAGLGAEGIGTGTGTGTGVGVGPKARDMNGLIGPVDTAAGSDTEARKNTGGDLTQLWSSLLYHDSSCLDVLRWFRRGNGGADLQTAAISFGYLFAHLGAEAGLYVGDDECLSDCLRPLTSVFGKLHACVPEPCNYPPPPVIGAATLAEYSSHSEESQMCAMLHCTIAGRLALDYAFRWTAAFRGVSANPTPTTVTSAVPGPKRARHSQAQGIGSVSSGASTAAAAALAALHPPPAGPGDFGAGIASGTAPASQPQAQQAQAQAESYCMAGPWAIPRIIQLFPKHPMLQEEHTLTSAGAYLAQRAPHLWTHLQILEQVWHNVNAAVLTPLAHELKAGSTASSSAGKQGKATEEKAGTKPKPDALALIPSDSTASSSVAGGSASGSDPNAAFTSTQLAPAYVSCIQASTLISLDRQLDEVAADADIMALQCHASQLGGPIALFDFESSTASHLLRLLQWQAQQGEKEGDSSDGKWRPSSTSLPECATCGVVRASTPSDPSADSDTGTGATTGEGGQEEGDQWQRCKVCGLGVYCSLACSSALTNRHRVSEWCKPPAKLLRDAISTVVAARASHLAAVQREEERQQQLVQRLPEGKSRAQEPQPEQLMEEPVPSVVSDGDRRQVVEEAVVLAESLVVVQEAEGQGQDRVQALEQAQAMAQEEQASLELEAVSRRMAKQAQKALEEEEQASRARQAAEERRLREAAREADARARAEAESAAAAERARVLAEKQRELEADRERKKEALRLQKEARAKERAEAQAREEEGRRAKEAQAKVQAERQAMQAEGELCARVHAAEKAAAEAADRQKRAFEAAEVKRRAAAEKAAAAASARKAAAEAKRKATEEALQAALLTQGGPSESGGNSSSSPSFLSAASSSLPGPGQGYGQGHGQVATSGSAAAWGPGHSAHLPPYMPMEQGAAMEGLYPSAHAQPPLPSGPPPPLQSSTGLYNKPSLTLTAPAAAHPHAGQAGTASAAASAAWASRSTPGKGGRGSKQGLPPPPVSSPTGAAMSPSAAPFLPSSSAATPASPAAAGIGKEAASGPGTASSWTAVLHAKRMEDASPLASLGSVPAIHRPPSSSTPAAGPGVGTAGTTSGTSGEGANEALLLGSAMDSVLAQSELEVLRAELSATKALAAQALARAEAAEYRAVVAERILAQAGLTSPAAPPSAGLGGTPAPLLSGFSGALASPVPAWAVGGETQGREGAAAAGGTGPGVEPARDLSSLFLGTLGSLTGGGASGVGEGAVQGGGVPAGQGTGGTSGGQAGRAAMSGGLGLGLGLASLGSTPGGLDSLSHSLDLFALNPLELPASSSTAGHGGGTAGAAGTAQVQTGPLPPGTQPTASEAWDLSSSLSYLGLTKGLL